MTQDAFKSYSSFSGSDLVVNFNNRVIGELQQITYAVHREKAPIFTLGSADARSFSRGKRGISGSLAFLVFDRDALFEEIKSTTEMKNWYGFTAAGNHGGGNLTREGLQSHTTGGFMKLLSMTDWNKNSSAAGDGPKDIFGLGGEQIASQVDIPLGFAPLTMATINYLDQMPPFEVTLTFANEYGNTAWQKIFGVEVLNEGGGVSVDSIVLERQLTYVARKISPIKEGAYITNRQVPTGGEQ
jgi:hypothetical protein